MTSFSIDIAPGGAEYLPAAPTGSGTSVDASCSAADDTVTIRFTGGAELNALYGWVSTSQTPGPTVVAIPSMEYKVSGGSVVVHLLARFTGALPGYTTPNYAIYDLVGTSVPVHSPPICIVAGSIAATNTVSTAAYG